MPSSKKFKENKKLVSYQSRQPNSSYKQIKKILEEAKGKDLFKNIEDPSEWQRQIRDEWESDFTDS